MKHRRNLRPYNAALSPVLIFMCALLLGQCAGQVPPSGGPPDTVPPKIIRTLPDSNAVRVEMNAIELEFSKYVERRSVEESIFISPYPGDLTFDWSGTTVSIRFAQPLRKNKTYVVNVGTDVKDLRAGTRMAAGFTLAFSSGDSIDRGFISGRVFDEKPEGLMMFAYALQGIKPDTLDPSRVKPDYITQTGSGGTFTFANIAFGRYRLFAVRDEYRNLLYDRQIDQYGVTTGDIAVSALQGRVADVWFRLSREDTTKPFLVSVTPLNRKRLLVRFSKDLDTLSFEHATFALTDTLTGRAVDIRLTYLNRSAPSTAGLVTVGTLDSGATYRLRVDHVNDRARNPIDTSHASSVFPGVTVPDTVKPTMSVRGLVDSMRAVSLDQVVEIDFSKPIEHDPLAKAVSLLDSTRTPVEVTTRWLNATDLALQPKQQLRERSRYAVLVVLDSVRDLEGNRYHDSVYTLRFETMDMRTTGGIDGTFLDEQGERGKGPLFITASGVDPRSSRTATLRLPAPGKFSFEGLVEGRYVLHAFRDADSSGSFSCGLPFPFTPSERFAVFPDTLKVRARWRIEGVKLVLR
jgi:hypothetical protein